MGYNIEPTSSSTNQNAALMIDRSLDFSNNEYLNSYYLKLCGGCVTRMTGMFSSTMYKKTDFTLNNFVVCLCFSSVQRKSQANVIKVSAVILNLFSFSLFDPHVTDKPEMMYVSCSLFSRSDNDKPNREISASLWLLPMNIK